MATQKSRKKSSRIGAKGKRTSHRREIQKWAARTTTFVSVVSPWLIFWISSGR